MQVVKVLNNSLVLAVDDDGNEIILMGKGIGFNKSIGNQFKPEEIEKVFVLKDKGLSKNIIKLASEVDGKYFEYAKAIIDYAVDRYDMQIMDYLYLSLTDHLSFAAKRASEGIFLANFYTQEMKKFNPSEYDVGLFAVKLIRDGEGIDFPDDEAGSIAFHFINAQSGTTQVTSKIVIMKTVTDILDIVKYHFGITFNEETFEYTRFLTHLRLFAQRLLADEQVREQDDLLFSHIIETCKRENECVDKIRKYVLSALGKEITFQEKVYLIIHIHRILMSQDNIEKEDL